MLAAVWWNRRFFVAAATCLSYEALEMFVQLEYLDDRPRRQTTTTSVKIKKTGANKAAAALEA